MLYYTQIWLYFLFYFPLRWICGKYTLKIESKSELTTKPLIIAMNHNARIDPILLLLLPFSVIRNLAPIKFMTAEYYYRIWWLRMLINPFGAFSLKKMAWTYEEYFSDSINILKRRENLLIFPEGIIISPKNRNEVRPGIGYLVSTSKEFVLPIRIKGSETITIKNVIFRRVKLKLHVGKAFHVSGPTPDYKSISARILKRIYTLN